MKVFVVHYSEIALKGKNRGDFEKKLMENIRSKIEKIERCRIKRRYGRIIVESDNEEIAERLKKIPGIKYFALAEVSKLDIDDIVSKALSIPLSGRKFKVETKRSNKRFPLTSIEVNRIVGEAIAKARNLKVDLKNPDETVYIEICEKECYIYTKKIYGIGGLPCGIAKVVSLLSGLKSAVATLLIMKRGAEVVAVNFSDPSIVDLAKKLSEYHRLKLYLIPKRCDRVEMLEISNEIAKNEDAKAIVVGDIVHSDDELEKLSKIYSKSELPIFTPIICFSDEDVENIAKNMGLKRPTGKLAEFKETKVFNFDY